MLRLEQTKGFVLLKKRWDALRTFGWVMGNRRLVKDARATPRNIGDIYLPCHDPYHAQAAGMKSHPSKLFKHPLRAIALWCFLTMPGTICSIPSATFL